MHVNFPKQAHVISGKVNKAFKVEICAPNRISILESVEEVSSDVTKLIVLLIVGTLLGMNPVFMACMMGIIHTFDNIEEIVNFMIPLLSIGLCGFNALSPVAWVAMILVIVMKHYILSNAAASTRGNSLEITDKSVSIHNKNRVKTFEINDIHVAYTKLDDDALIVAVVGKDNNGKNVVHDFIVVNNDSSINDIHMSISESEINVNSILGV